MRWKQAVWVLIPLMVSCNLRVQPAKVDPNDGEHLVGACTAWLSRFDSLVYGLHFDEAQCLVDSMGRMAEVDSGWQAAFYSRWMASALTYVENRDGRALDTLEHLYVSQGSSLCSRAYSRLGLVLAAIYTRNENPALALMYTRAVLRVAKEMGDEGMVQAALLQMLTNSWQLGDTHVVDSIQAELGRLSVSAEGRSHILPRALRLVDSGQWEAVAVALDSLRGEYLRSDNLLWAGYVAQGVAAARLKQGDTEQALSLLRWVDSLPSQRVPAQKVFASWTLYGRCYAARGEFQKAIVCYQRALADAESVHASLYRAKVLRLLGDVYRASGNYRRAVRMKSLAVSLQDSVASALSVKLFRSVDNMRGLQETQLAYERKLAQEQRQEAKRNRWSVSALIALALAITLVEILLYRLWIVLIEKRKQGEELQSLTVVLRQRSEVLDEQGKRLERLHAEALKQTNQLLRVHSAMRGKTAKTMQSVTYASSIQQSLLPTAQERQALFADSFLIARAKNVVSGDLLWLGRCGDQVVAVAVDCTGYGVSGASLSFIAYMLLNSVVLERGISDPPAVLKEVDVELRELLQGTDKRFQGEVDIDLSVLTIHPATRTASFSGEGRQLFYSPDGRTVHCLHGNACALDDSSLHGPPLTMATISYAPGALFYLLTDGLVQQLNSDHERLGMQRISRTLEKILQLPMPEQERELLGLFARHRLAEEQTDDITVLGMRMA